ncbi:acylphosphatase [Methyloligella sp. 2.7D]|uniref:acylphosphatase n=1 Tax=unclassified Methyloligella TaxID=2625955 RepID=UPI00157D2DC4|nr:acylphosphatase [Methyloligella sp. GL2]QKP77404.1 acylphosphatase [Methyloligella sp. GL2]
MTDDESTRRTVLTKIKGRVQGVYYRVWAKENAEGLSLDGWARNLQDGSVEAVFSGAPEAVSEMLERCKEGPPDAMVREVEIVAEGGAPPSGFQVIASEGW